jgi:putative membrane protein
MSLVATVLVGLIAALHLYIAWFEIFAWTTKGPKIFRQFPPDLFGPTKVLAANQGFYNAMLAAGLIWSLVIANPDWQANVATCFLLMVAAAGIFGAFTAARRILYVQSAPALVALAAVWLA